MVGECAKGEEEEEEEEGGREIASKKAAAEVIAVEEEGGRNEVGGGGVGVGVAGKGERKNGAELVDPAERDKPAAGIGR